MEPLSRRSTVAGAPGDHLVVKSRPRCAACLSGEGGRGHWFARMGIGRCNHADAGSQGAEELAAAIRVVLERTSDLYDRTRRVVCWRRIWLRRADPRVRHAG